MRLQFAVGNRTAHQRAHFATIITLRHSVGLPIHYFVKAKEGIALAKKHFGEIPAGAPPPFADPSEPEQGEERRGNVEEKFGTLPAMAIGYVIPKRRTADWCAMALLDQALHGGRAGRMHRELVIEKQIAVEAGGGIDDIFGYNGPTQMVTRLLH